MNYKFFKEKVEELSEHTMPKMFFTSDPIKAEHDYIEQIRKFLDDDIRSLDKKEKEVLFFIIKNMIDAKVGPVANECRFLKIKLNIVLSLLVILIAFLGAVIVPLLLRITNGG